MTLRQGFLEDSSVDPVREITELIEAQRGYFHWLVTEGTPRLQVMVVAARRAMVEQFVAAAGGPPLADVRAAAFVIGNTPGKLQVQILDTHTVGLADCGRGPFGITMVPRDGGLVMHYGKDIFMHAVREMAAMARRSRPVNPMTTSAPARASPGVHGRSK